MKSRAGILLGTAALILVAQAAATYAFRRDPYLPTVPPLALIPERLGSWQFAQEGVVEPEVLEVLAPDDSLLREYQLSETGSRGALFVAYYKTQLRAKNAHDPKVCLPGSGWNPRLSKVMDIAIPGRAAIPVNYYRIAKGNAEAVVLYWFQTHSDVVSKEQELRAHRLISSVRDNRTDMALVRIVVPVDENGVDAADARAVQLSQLIYPQMLPYFPLKETAGS